MGISYTDARYKIDGLIRTDNDVMTNLEKLCNAAGAWLTYDTHEGKFAVVINQAGSSQWSFDDSNIIGPINIAMTPIDKLYNTVKVVYPHEDLKGEPDWVQISIPQVDRLETEYENVLSLDYGIVTNPVQAELLGFIELKQSRVDKVVTFKTDFSKIGVKAGDLFDITNSIYGWDAKMFRVISVSETDADDGSIEINIVGLEYDATVYDEDLTRYIRTDNDDIPDLSSLQAPTKPTVTTNEVSSSPSITMTTRIMSGLVEEVEFWSSPDVNLSDDQREYTLVTTLVSSSSSGTDTFALDTDLTTTVDTASAVEFVVKARGKNKDGVSLFSLPSDHVTYNPVQTTDNLSDSVTAGLPGRMIYYFAQILYPFASTCSGYSGRYWMGSYVKAANMGSFVAPVSGRYAVRANTTYLNNVGNDTSPMQGNHAFKNQILALYTGGFYNGALSAGDGTLGSAAGAIVSGAVDYLVTSDNNDPLTSVAVERIVQLVKGQRYYCNAFYALQAPAEGADLSFNITYTGFA